MQNYSAIVSVRSPKAPINIAGLFDANYKNQNNSPIDQFLDNCIRLNQHWTKLQAHEDIPPELGILLLLGYVSAVEGYMRALIRRLIHIDPFTQILCESQQVAFGAVMHHNEDDLPDALLEETVFSGSKVVNQALGKFIGINNLSSSTKLLIEEYDRICQLRHCCVHRFGKLGVKNAIALGLREHASFLEKPVTIGKTALEEIVDLMFALVKSVNNEVFGFVLERSATSKLENSSVIGIGWEWKITKDKEQFSKYYSIFACTKDATQSPKMKVLYDMFKQAHYKVKKIK